MELTVKQRDVIRGAIPAAVLSAVGVASGALLIPASALPGEESGARLAWAAHWALIPSVALMICIMRVANHRFATPEDIDGSGLTPGTARVLVLRAILQNTLEQALLAFAAYCIWAVSMPARWLGVIPAAALLFAIGRISFALGYERGAGGRAVGFGLTAYPAFGMLVVSMIALGLRLFHWSFD